MPGKCCFNKSWLDQKNWKLWLQPVEKDNRRAYCTFCKSSFYVGHSGISAVKTHEKGKRHYDVSVPFSTGKQTTLYFKTSEVSKECTQETAHSSGITSSSKRQEVNDLSASVMSDQDQISKVQESCDPAVVMSSDQMKMNLNRYLLKDDTIKAEIIWALNKVITHGSCRGESSASELFPIMFPDSIIAKQFLMKKDKLSYVITYGLGPYFQKQLVDDIKKCDYFTVSFDESLNKVAQKGQMDIVIRYWDNLHAKVSTRYLTSTFLESGTSDNLLKSFINVFNELELPLKKITQIAVDGPNVNLKFLRDIKEFLKADSDPDEPGIFETGTCSLHIVQGAYKTAHNGTGWNIHQFLRAIYYLFKDFPSRRAEYTRLSGKSVFPLKFCSIRWVENSNVLSRAVTVIPALRQYVNTKTPPSSKNFSTVKEILSDKLLVAKLEFLLSIANQLEHFLVMFQSNKPLLPFLYGELFSILKEIARRFIKSKVMDEIKGPMSLLKLDLNNKDVLKIAAEVDIGFGAKKACSGIKDIDQLCFRNECRKYLKCLFEKLVKKCPLHYKVVRGASCISPDVMKNENLRLARIDVALEEFVNKNHITPAIGDKIKRDYLQLCENPAIQKKLKSFKLSEESLDTFLMNLLEEAKIESLNLKKFFEKILILFHGNAEVERGFSINKQCLLENLKEDSLIAQRSVYGGVSSVGGIKDLVISKSMIMYVKNASSRRVEALQLRQTLEEEQRKKTKELTKEIKVLEEKRKRLLQEKTEEAAELDQEIKKLKTKL